MIHRPSIQPLERRVLFSSTLADGLLTVRGTDAADTYALTVSRGALYVRATEAGVASTKRFVLGDVDAVLLYGNGGADAIDLRELAVPAAVDAGRGDDTVQGGAGRDTLKGAAGDDALSGNDGDDLIDGGTGADAMAGNRGRDTADYRKRTANLRVGLGSLPDDGEPGEGDTVATTFEVVRGGAGHDTLLTTSRSPVTLIGGAGDDTLIGNDGDDALDGGPGVDLLQGDDGDDAFYAADGLNDRVEGGPGTDRFVTRDGKERVYDVP